MAPRKLFIIISILVSVLLGGCSIKPVRYDELFYYEDEYYNKYYDAGLRQDHVKFDSYNYRAWQMSQYYRKKNEPGYQTYVDVNTESNANRSSGNYRPGETSVRQAPNRSIQVRQITRSNRVKQRKNGKNQKLIRKNGRDFQSSKIGSEQRLKAERLRRKKMKKTIDTRKREREEDKELTEEEREEQRQNTHEKKK